MIYKIIQKDDPVLRQKAKKLSLEEIKSEKIQSLIISMKETLRAAPGVGLAAPQIGISLQLIVIEDREEYFSAMLPAIREERGRKAIAFHVIINPKLTVIDSEQAIFFEGCLSVGGCMRVTPRAKQVQVDYLDENGNQKNIQANGWYARILQHEIDHLNGKLYLDKANQKTEIELTEENRKKWLNAREEEVKKLILD